MMQESRRSIGDQAQQISVDWRVDVENLKERYGI